MNKRYLVLKGIAGLLILIVGGGLVYFYGLHPRVSSAKKLSLARWDGDVRARQVFS